MTSTCRLARRALFGCYLDIEIVCAELFAKCHIPLIIESVDLRVELPYSLRKLDSKVSEKGRPNTVRPWPAPEDRSQ